jgi:hypothetical protein
MPGDKSNGCPIKGSDFPFNLWPISLGKFEADPSSNHEPLP